MEQTLPTRKPIRLKRYDYGQNGAYFITICTQNKSKILCDIVGEGFPLPKRTGLIAENVLMQIPTKYPCVSVDKYVIMPNHIHILLSIQNDGRGNPSPTIETIMGWYKYTVTKQVNAENGTVGTKIFQRSFHDHIIRGEQDYLEIWQYIENNPLKWTLDEYYQK